MTLPQQVYDKHPELFHYTTWDGVSGILKSQNLRATHYRYLNDVSELQLMQVELGTQLFPLMKEEMVRLYRQASFRMKRKIKNSGGTIIAARKEAMHWANVFYRTAFVDDNLGRALAVPYITSFCAHTSDHRYEQMNGLLSQWRGYASRGGFAIVFDTKALCNLYRQDWERHDYTYSFLGDVVYQGDDSQFKEEFGSSLQKIQDVFSKYIKTGQWEIGEIFGDVLSMFTRLKHRGFREEREVRLVAFPMTKAIEREYKRADPHFLSSGKPLKRIHNREDGALYIEAPDLEKKSPLPIERIIIGPQHDQKNAKRRLEQLLYGTKISVHSSETPLVWPRL